ncbi:hypothetical protein JCM11491_007112 [Sporobolomyces phaffii]
MILPTAVTLSLLTLSSALPFTPSSVSSFPPGVDVAVGSWRYPSFLPSTRDAIEQDPPARTRRRSLAVDLGAEGGGIVVLDSDPAANDDDGSLKDDSSFRTSSDDVDDGGVFDLPTEATPAPAKVVKNPKVVPNPKNPYFSSSLAAQATTTTTTTTTTPSATATAAAKTFTGQATYFYQGGVAGACGNVNPDSAYIVALDYRLYGDLGKVSKYCGKSLTITNTDNGKSVVATVADACPTCDSKYSLDLSEGAFGAIGAYDTGILPIEWHWN